MIVGWRDGRLVGGVSCGPIPGDAWGAFTTVGCDRGQPLLWERHNRRLAGSLENLGAASSVRLPSPNDLVELLSVNGLSGPARLRVVGRRHSASGWQVEAGVVAIEEAGPATPPQSLAVHQWPAVPPSAGHKLLARQAWDTARVEAMAAGCEDALIIDADDHVCETSIANVWVVFDDQVFTPPAPARCLPGVMRSWLLQHLGDLGFAAREHDLTLSDLSRADELWTSNTIIGVRRVGTVAEWRWREWPVYERVADHGLPAPVWPEPARRFASR
jgi:branched-subunit amino acid aminotransferase/4-amino-4-deoxychorismate lyase